MLSPLLFLSLMGCPQSDDFQPVDLTQPVASGQSRAGVVTDPSVLWGGVSAEGQPGDALLVNDRIRFVVQGTRKGSFYFVEGGGILDADIVRPAGEPGRDIVEEWREVLATARINAGTSMTVVDSGVNSDAARVLVSGSDTGIDLISGVLEAPDFLESLGLTVTTEYRLPPDSWFMEVTTVITASEDVALVDIGDILITGTEVADRWRSGSGLSTNSGPTDFLASIAHQNDVAVMLATVDGAPLGEPIPLLSELGDIDLGIGAAGELPAGETLRYTRLYGVGPDLATLTDELLDRRGVASETVSGTVTAADGPVARARVALFLDGDPWSVAVTADDGTWQANVPTDATVTWRAVGRNTGYFGGLPGMSGHHSPFVNETAGQLWLDALREPTASSPDGRGVASAEDPLVLGDPARVTIRSTDATSFEARARLTSAEPPVDGLYVPARPQGGVSATGWARNGEIELLLEAGTYEVLVHKGIRFEQYRETIEVVAGQELTVDASIPAAYEHSGWLLGDPHQHASPSNDGNVSMEERILVNAARGIQLPFGTDHDRLADYNVLIEPLGLQDDVRSVIANEVSSVRRGHMNAYPLTVQPELPNNGAYLWYIDVPSTTEDYVAKTRAAYPGAMLQWNHPFSSGVADSADYRPGFIGNPDFWSDDVDVIEVLNDGDYEREVGLYLDLVNRGYPVTPTGVSDAHGRTNSGIGFCTTFLYMQTDSVADYTDERLVDVIEGGNTIVSLGPYLDMSIVPGTRVVGNSSVLSVTARHPTWMDVDQLELYRDGMLVELVEGTTASFALDSEIDASYVVMARGDTRMELYNNTPPWAMSAAIFVDVDGDGWEAPLPPLERG